MRAAHGLKFKMKEPFMTDCTNKAFNNFFEVEDRGRVLNLFERWKRRNAGTWKDVKAVKKKKKKKGSRVEGGLAELQIQ